MHLDDGLLHADLKPFAALDDGGGEPHLLDLGHLDRDLLRSRGEAVFVVAYAVRRALVGALVGVASTSWSASSSSMAVGLNVVCFLA